MFDVVIFITSFIKKNYKEYSCDVLLQRSVLNYLSCIIFVLKPTRA